MINHHHHHHNEYYSSDLLTVVGVPAIDPVLKRAQFNQKINSLTQVSLMIKIKII